MFPQFRRAALQAVFRDVRTIAPARHSDTAKKPSAAKDERFASVVPPLFHAEKQRDTLSR
jgi:hypothetical protein